MDKNKHRLINRLINIVAWTAILAITITIWQKILEWAI